MLYYFIDIVGDLDMILESERLLLREMTLDDYPALCSILQDDEVMYAYEHSFSDEEVHAWLANQLRRYHEDGFGLWAVICKENNVLIGQCGLTIQKIEDQEVVEIGYLFRKDYWHKGYAIEAAQACKTYAFEELAIDEVYSIIRDNNISSQTVAMRNGMHMCGRFVKHYYNIDMPHFIYRIKKTSP